MCAPATSEGLSLGHGSGGRVDPRDTPGWNARLYALQVRVFWPGLAVTLAASLVLAAGTAAASRTDENVILAGLARAAAAGHMPRGEAAADASLARRASRLWPKLPAGRAAPLRDVLDDVAA